MDMKKKRPLFFGTDYKRLVSDMPGFMATKKKV